MPGIAAAGTKEPDAGRKNFPFFLVVKVRLEEQGCVFSAGAGNEMAQFVKFPKKWEKVANASKHFIVQKSNFPRLL